MTDRVFAWISGNWGRITGTVVGAKKGLDVYLAGGAGLTFVGDMKGVVTKVHDAITGTATSDAVDCEGYNSLLVLADISISKNWTFKVTGCDTSGGTFKDCYANNGGTMAVMSYQTNSSKVFMFTGVPDYIKVVATEDEDGATVTVKVQPLNI
jgi:hypothetical protein